MFSRRALFAGVGATAVAAIAPKPRSLVTVAEPNFVQMPGRVFRGFDFASGDSFTVTYCCGYNRDGKLVITDLGEWKPVNEAVRGAA